MCSIQVGFIGASEKPYKEALSGVLEEGAWADMLLVNGDPTRDINLLADPQLNFLLIIKNGSIYRKIVPKAQGILLFAVAQRATAAELRRRVDLSEPNGD